MATDSYINRQNESSAEIRPARLRSAGRISARAYPRLPQPCTQLACWICPEFSSFSEILGAAGRVELFRPVGTLLIGSAQDITFLHLEVSPMEGQSITRNETLIEIIDQDSLKIELYVPQNEIEHYATGKDIKLPILPHATPVTCAKRG